jgi:hypothetical protein
MRSRQQLARDAERRFPVRVRIAVPSAGLGVRLTQMHDCSIRMPALTGGR